LELILNVKTTAVGQCGFEQLSVDRVVWGFV